MVDILVDGLTFQFPGEWSVSKYDDWGFYRNKFGRMWDGIKSLDLLAIDPQKIGWLIEVKDYRANTRTKSIDLGQEVAKKVFDTLAALAPAKLNSDNEAEKIMAKAMLAARRYRVVLHLEQPIKHSKLFPRAINSANVQQKLRQLLKPIDPHALVCERQVMRGVEWQVL